GAEAPTRARLVQEFCLPPSRIVVEDISRTTAENAALLRAKLSPHAGQRWLLVTSAFHMPRAVGAFRKAGFSVEAYPVDWRTRGWVDASLPFDRLNMGLGRTDLAL